MRKYYSTFINSILAGICISLGGTIFLSIKDAFPSGKTVGALLFTIGLFTICTRGYNLFTGKACYILDNRNLSYIWYLFIIWIGNFIGCAFVALLENLTSICGIEDASKLNNIAYALVENKMNNNSLLSLFILGFFCNLFIFIAVDGFKNNQHELGKYLSLFLGVAGFILSGTEHCIADMYYWCVSDMIIKYPMKSIICLVIISLGNVCGGLFMGICEKIVKKYQ